MSLIDRLSGVMDPVSMKSGLEGRNNGTTPERTSPEPPGLNEVRPRRPEQYHWCEVRGPHPRCLNEVRPRRPEQFSVAFQYRFSAYPVSMKSGLEGRNNVTCCAT